jgi:hypothetical protein
MPGSPHGTANAEFMASLLGEWGYRVEIKRYDVLFPTPRTRLVELVSPTRFAARLTEPPVAGDALSELSAEALPTFKMYSIDSDVTGDLVYVNYGDPADYEELARRGIDVEGKIVIARYGDSWRGNRRVDDGTLVLAADPALRYVAPDKKDVVPDFDVKPLREAVKRLRVAARRFDAAATSAVNRPAATLAPANAIIFKVEMALTRADGLPRRPS